MHNFLFLRNKKDFWHSIQTLKTKILEKNKKKIFIHTFKKNKIKYTEKEKSYSS